MPDDPATTDDGERAPSLALSIPQRRSLGVIAAELRRSLAELQGMGLAAERLAGVAREVDAIERDGGALRPRAAESRVGALLTSMLVLAAEMDARHMKGYGGLTAETAGWLDRASDRLSAAVMDVLGDDDVRTSSDGASPSR